jgi:hypothetical protein
MQVIQLSDGCNESMTFDYALFFQQDLIRKLCGICHNVHLVVLGNSKMDLMLRVIVQVFRNLQPTETRLT